MGTQALSSADCVKTTHTKLLTGKHGEELWRPGAVRILAGAVLLTQYSF